MMVAPRLMLTDQSLKYNLKKVLICASLQVIRQKRIAVVWSGVGDRRERLSIEIKSTGI